LWGGDSEEESAKQDKNSNNSYGDEEDDEDDEDDEAGGKDGEGYDSPGDSILEFNPNTLIGKMLQIQNCEGDKAHFNGKEGECIRYDFSTNEYLIQLKSPYQVARLKVENISKPQKRRL